MQLTNLKALLGLMSTTHAFIVPSGLTEGVYTVSLGKNGTALSEPVPFEIDASKPAHKGRTELGARAFPSISTSCGGYNINGGDLDQAQASFGCTGQWVQPNVAIFAWRENAVVYMCNYGQWNPCHSSEFWDAMGIIGNQCSWYGAGSIDIPSWKKGYGRANVGADICWF